MSNFSDRVQEVMACMLSVPDDQPGFHKLHANNGKIRIGREKGAPPDKFTIAFISKLDRKQGPTRPMWAHIESRIRSLIKEGIL